MEHIARSPTSHPAPTPSWTGGDNHKLFPTTLGGATWPQTTSPTTYVPPNRSSSATGAPDPFLKASGGVAKYPGRPRQISDPLSGSPAPDMPTLRLPARRTASPVDHVPTLDRDADRREMKHMTGMMSALVTKAKKEKPRRAHPHPRAPPLSNSPPPAPVHRSFAISASQAAALHADPFFDDFEDPLAAAARIDPHLYPPLLYLSRPPSYGPYSSSGDAEASQASPVERKKHKRSKKPAKIFRQCMNCGTRKSPQWRSGPDGWGDLSASALCNRCGVSFRNCRISPRQNFPGLVNAKVPLQTLATQVRRGAYYGRGGRESSEPASSSSPPPPPHRPEAAPSMLDEDEGADYMLMGMADIDDIDLSELMLYDGPAGAGAQGVGPGAGIEELHLDVDELNALILTNWDATPMENAFFAADPEGPL